MSKVITFSTRFPKGHIKEGQPTYFVEKFWNQRHSEGIEIPAFNFTQYIATLKDGLKYNQSYYDYLGVKSHTIRLGKRFKKGEYFSPRIWNGRPYHDGQITFAPDTLITGCWDIIINAEKDKMQILLPRETQNKTNLYALSVKEVAKNDALTVDEFMSWFNPKAKTFETTAQIICWDKKISY